MPTDAFMQRLDQLRAAHDKHETIRAEMKHINAKMEKGDDSPGLTQRFGNLTIAQAKLADEITRLRDFSGTPGEIDPDALESGADGSRQGGKVTAKAKPKQVLARTDSVADWLKGRGAGQGSFDVEAGWDAFARGMIGNDWQPWKQDFEVKASMSTAEPGGGYLVPDVLSGSVIDRMRALTPIFRAGAQTVPMTASTLDIARVTGDPTASWHSESAAITASDATLDRVRFTARTLPVLVKVSRELAEDAPNLGAVVQQAIAGAIGAEITRVALRGSGTAPEPDGVLNQTGVELFAIGANGGALTIDMLIDRVVAIRNANAEPNAVITSPRTDGGITKLAKDSQGNYFALPSPLAELGRFYTTTVPNNLAKGTGTNLSELYMGDWAQLLIGMRTALRIETLRERFADTGEYAFLAWMRMDVQLAHGAAFSVITDTTT